jgi:hypothetical protein
LAGTREYISSLTTSKTVPKEVFSITTSVGGDGVGGDGVKVPSAAITFIVCAARTVTDCSVPFVLLKVKLTEILLLLVIL